MRQQIIYKKEEHIPMTLEFRHHEEKVMIITQNEFLKVKSNPNQKVALLNVIDLQHLEANQLCHISTLYSCLKPISCNPHDIIYTPNVHFYERADEINVISYVCDVNELNDDINKQKRMLDVARAHHNDIVILNTFDAEAYQQFINEYKQYFDVMVIVKNENQKDLK